MAVTIRRDTLMPKWLSNSPSSLAMIAWRSDGRDVVVADHDAPLGGEFADLLAVGRHQPGNGARLVVVERADGGDIVGVDEHQSAESAQKGGHDEKREQAGPPGESDDDPGAGPQW